MSGFEVVRVAERALLLRFADLDLTEAVSRAQAVWFEAKKNERLSLKGKARNKKKDEERSVTNSPADSTSAWKGKIVLGAGSLLVELERGAGGAELDAARVELERLARVAAPSSRVESRPAHRIDVRYGGEEGPDLGAVAVERGLSPERAVELHAGAEYTVAFVGFCPGFPYLVGLPPELEVPRLDSPRALVPAGSVAIAGAFGAVYPSATPGGWRLIGRTDAPLFDPSAVPAARLAPGDRVRFVPR